jgi:hypothetical protein
MLVNAPRPPRARLMPGSVIASTGDSAEEVPGTGSSFSRNISGMSIISREEYTYRQSTSGTCDGACKVVEARALEKVYSWSYTTSKPSNSLSNPGQQVANDWSNTRYKAENSSQIEARNRSVSAKRQNIGKVTLLFDTNSWQVGSQGRKTSCQRDAARQTTDDGEKVAEIRSASQYGGQNWGRH